MNSSQSESSPAVWDPNLPAELARTPPAHWYRSSTRDQLERQAVLAAGWQVLAHRDEVAEPGSYVAGCSGGEPWVIARDEVGELRALSNVCRHNGTQVATGRGQSDRLVCPYHGWAYHLDGRLAKAPRIGGIRGFDRTEFSLGKLRVQEIGPLIFVNLSDGPMMDVNVVFPLGPERCKVQFDWYFEPGCDEEFISRSIAASEQVQLEDIAICESLQVGMGSMHFKPGPYAPTVELSKHQFHRLLAGDVSAYRR